MQHWWLVLMPTDSIWKMELVVLCPLPGAMPWSTSNLGLWLLLWAHSCHYLVQGQSSLWCPSLPVTPFPSCCAVAIRSPRITPNHLSSGSAYWNLLSVKNKLHPKKPSKHKSHASTKRKGALIAGISSRSNKFPSLGWRAWFFSGS